MTVTFRAPEDDDWPWMAEAHARTAWESLPTSRRRATDLGRLVPHAERMVADMRAPDGPSRLVRVAQSLEGARAGFLWAEEARTGMTGEAFALITEVFVEERFRRRGLGRRLLAEADAWARARGLTRLALNVAVANPGARALYARAGYAVETMRMGKAPRTGEATSAEDATREIGLRPPEILETARLRLRPLVSSDADAVFAYAGSEAVTKYMDFARHRTLDESQAFARRCEECWRSGTAFPWAIEVRETGIFIGCIELRIDTPKADFGYVLDESAWGHGYATEAATAVVSWAIAQPGIHRVWATSHPANRASIRVLEKAGLVYEARLKNWLARPNLGEAAGDCLMFAVVESVA